MKKTIFSLAAALAVVTCLAGCGQNETKPSNTAYRARDNVYHDGQYYAANDGTVYDAGDPARTGLLGDFRNMANDAADGARNVGNAVGNTIDDMAN